MRRAQARELQHRAARTLKRAASGAGEAVALVRSASAPVSMPNDSKTV
jgi:hypothetical protein